MPDKRKCFGDIVITRSVALWLSAGAFSFSVAQLPLGIVIRDADLIAGGSCFLLITLVCLVAACFAPSSKKSKSLGTRSFTKIEKFSGICLAISWLFGIPATSLGQALEWSWLIWTGVILTLPIVVIYLGLVFMGFPWVIIQIIKQSGDTDQER